MPISIDYQAADQILLDALDLAQSDAKFPVVWKSHARAVFDLEAKTWTPAFGTILLAKAIDDRIDTMSLKFDESNAFSYSARGLCHTVLVPAAKRYGFSIRNTGREPLNNQPFFRYDRIDRIDRVRRPADREYFLDVAEQASALTRTGALQALAAFLREALQVAASSRSVRVKAAGLTMNGARVAVEDFLRHNAQDRPQRLQAFAAACLDLLFEEVKTRRLNDPSRDLPGDVHAVAHETVILALEVRGKTVSVDDLGGFADDCEAAGVSRAIMFVDAPQQIDLAVHVMINNQRRSAVQVEAYGSAAQLLGACSLWSQLPLGSAIEHFAERFLARLREIEVPTDTLKEWERAVAVAQSR
ncbi:restriction endonuclease, SacI family [Curtobacterium poinsettiae]|uniref:restriction endonuclease, SacI family n=1 Tax=Curtobacterium TaxID=2034 RepID=UPI00217DB4AB|nr:restriction endonuclease, SacI family [Curtobacterium flaccumfaciens]MCS6560292.1 restriction endonuclease, SacI family [Curtobacterium flaccumfaciens pv. poinsettiae]UXN27302.1 restriction endonuclease, SacI family [Curtobacterium flaccumfaciens]